jgi:Domain of unknown function (DUF4136)
MSLRRRPACIRSRLHVALALVTLASATGCASVSVSTDFDRSVNFSRYRTFAFVGGHLIINGVNDDGNTLVKDRIRGAVVGALRAKGLTETSDHPDLAVGYWAGAHSRTEMEGMPVYSAEMGPYWYGGWWGPGYAEWWTRTYEQGTIVIDLVDPASHRLVWRAYARTEVQAPLTDQQVSQVVEKSFRAFPPHP